MTSIWGNWKEIENNFFYIHYKTYEHENIDCLPLLKLLTQRNKNSESEILRKQLIAQCCTLFCGILRSYIAKHTLGLVINTFKCV